MGILRWLTGGGSGPVSPPPSLFVDLTRFRCNSLVLGEPATPSGGYPEPFDSQGTVADPSWGLELGIENGRVDYVFVTLARFQGRLFADGRQLGITQDTSPEAVVRLFGDPYWRDEDDDDVILFYEDGRFELQFEFPGKMKLGYITMMLSPILADPAQRKAYGVTKPWPPAGSIRAV